jgi:hypothetical protein
MAQAYVAGQYTVWWPMPPREAFDLWRQRHMMALGFVPVGEAGATINYQRSGTKIPTWAIVLAVVLFPIGLFFLLVKEPWEEHMTLSFAPAERGTWLTAQGHVTPAAQYQLDQLAAWYQRQPAQLPAG